MSHACHRCWKCHKTFTCCSLLRGCTIPCACHAKTHLNLQKWREHMVFCTCWLRHVLRTTTACTFSTSHLPKVLRRWCALYAFTSTCASRHNGVQFFDIATSKSVPKLVCFVHFDFEVCFAPQWRALFRHLNFQKCSDVGVLCTFWLGNLLRATTACNFSSLIWPNGSAPPALASLLFDPPEPQITRKTQCFATFLPLRAPSSSFFWLFLFSDLLSSTLLFYSPLLSDFSHLCFSSVHLVGSLTSKLPSAKWFRGTPILGNLHKSVVLLQSNIATSSNHSFRIPFQGQAKNHLTPTTPTAFPGVTAEVLMGWLTIFFDREPLVFYLFGIRFSCKSSPHIPFIQLREW